MVGKRYGQLPSDLMKKPLVWLCFDADVASRSIEFEIKRIDEARKSKSDSDRPDVKGIIAASSAEMPQGSKAKAFFDAMKG